VQVRRRFRLVLAGQKVEIDTNALDLAKAEREGEGPVVQGLRLMHQACLRQRVDGVPVKFDEFASMLDEFDDITDDEDGVGDMDPTRLAD
jgi:hypothetical protein